MMSRLSKTPSIPPRHAVEDKPPKPPVPVATDTAVRIGTADGGEMAISYWDAWYALLAQDRFQGDLDQLGRELRGMRTGFYGSEAANRKLSHLRDLQQRLADAGIGLPDILAALPPGLAKTERRRAFGRIIKHNQRSYELSEPMLELPGERLRERALRGLWNPFPVSPRLQYGRLRAKFNWRRYHEEDDSWGLAKKLDEAADSARKLADKGEFAEALAALRATLTVAIELVETADDSFGCIGQSFQDAFEHYLVVPRHKAGIPSEGFLTDLLELLVFEDAGLTYGHTGGFFASLTCEEGDFCLAYLRGRIPALLAWDLDYPAEKTLTLIGQVAAERKRFDLFEALAGEMGTREWQRIIRLADAAVRSRKRELADRVLQVALACEDGGHADFLAKKHAQLLHGKWNPGKVPVL